LPNKEKADNGEKLEQRKDMGSGASERHYYELGEVRDAIARQAKADGGEKTGTAGSPELECGNLGVPQQGAQ